MLTDRSYDARHEPKEFPPWPTTPSPPSPPSAVGAVGEVIVRVHASSVNAGDNGIAAVTVKDRVPHEFPVTLRRPQAHQGVRSRARFLRWIG
jgi:hypothetical protein